MRLFWSVILRVRSGTVGYNNKILVSDEKFILGKNDKVNVPAMKSTQTASKSNDVLAYTPTVTYKKHEPQTVTHNDDKNGLVLFLAGGFAIWKMFR